MTTERTIESKLVTWCPQCYVYVLGYEKGLECLMDCESEKTWNPVIMIRKRVWVVSCGCGYANTKTYVKGVMNNHECYA